MAAVDLADSAQRSVQPDQATLPELYERYLSRRRSRSPATIAQYKRTLPHFLEFVEAQGVTHPGTLSTDLVDAYVDELLETYDAESTIHTYTRNVRAWLRWLHKRGLCRESIYRILDKDELGLSPTARDEALPETRAIALLDSLS